MAELEIGARQLRVWETDEIRTRLTELYGNRGLPLKTVRQMLLEEGLDISERRLKAKIFAWGLQRNKTEKDVRALVKLYREREAAGRTTRIKHRGRIVLIDELYKHLGRKGIALDEIDNAEEEPLPIHLSCSTPSESGSPAEVTHLELDLLDNPRDDSDNRGVLVPNLLTPETQTYVNRLLHGVRTYYSMRLREETCPLATADSDIHELFPSMQLGACFKNHHSLTQLSKHMEAAEQLAQAQNMLQPVLNNQDPRLLTYVLESIAYTRSVGYDWLAAQLLWHLSRAANAVLEPSHPLTIIAINLFADRLFENAECLGLVLTCMIDVFSDTIGENHVETLRLILTASAILKHIGSYQLSETLLIRLQESYEIVYGSQSYQVTHAMIDRAHLKQEQGKLDDVQDLILSAMHSAEGILNWNEQIESKIRCLVALARFHGVNDDSVSMRHQLQLAIAVGQEGGLHETHWMIYDAHALLRSCPE